MTADRQYVLDASAVLAFIEEERGSERVRRALPRAALSAVNWSEVVQKSLVRGADVTGVRDELEALGVRIAPFTQLDVELTAELWPPTRRAGLSLADRACLALAARLGATAVTADRAWARLDIGVPVEIVR